MSALMLHVKRHEWQFFLSMTYRNAQTMRDSVRYSMQHQFLRNWCRFMETPFRKFDWLIREENGEATDRLHWHALCSGVPLRYVNEHATFWAMGFWEGMGGGMARIRVFDPRRSGVEYVMKGLEKIECGNTYELNKFGKAADDSLSGIVSKEFGGLIPALRLLRQWQDRIELNRRHRNAQDMRKAPRCDHASRQSRSRVFYVQPPLPRHPADDVRIHV